MSKMSQREIYNQLVELPTLGQYKQIMFGEMTYKSKAERVKLVSKSKRVHILADRIIALSSRPDAAPTVD